MEEIHRNPSEGAVHSAADNLLGPRVHAGGFGEVLGGPEVRFCAMVVWRNAGKDHFWLVVWNMTFIFPYIGNNHPN